MVRAVFILSGRFDYIGIMSNNEQKKTARITFLILISAIILLSGIYIIVANIIGSSFDVSTPEKSAEEIAAENKFFSMLDDLYYSGEYEGLVQLIYSNEAKSVDIQNYSHYDFAEFYKDYIKIRDYYIPLLDKGSLNGNDARDMTSIVFSFYYRCYDHTMGVTGNSTEDDIKILDDIRDEYITGILYDRMGYTSEDMESARKDIMKYNLFHIDKVYKYSDKYSERYR